MSCQIAKAVQLQGEAEETPAISPGRKIPVCLKREEILHYKRVTKISTKKRIDHQSSFAVTC